MMWFKIIAGCSRTLRRTWKMWCVRGLGASLGRKVFIEPTVDIQVADKVHIGDGCRLYRGVCINARSNSRVGIRLGRSVKIHEYSYIDSYGGSIVMEDHVGIGHHCVIGGQGGLVIGAYTMIAGLTYIIPANHIFVGSDIPYVMQGESRRGVSIGRNVWIGAGCIILDGVTIGDSCVIAAGAVVTRSVPPQSLVMGVPAKVVRTLATD